MAGGGGLGRKTTALVRRPKTLSDVGSWWVEQCWRGGLGAGACLSAQYSSGSKVIATG